MRIATTAIVYDKVSLGYKCVVEDFVLLGVLPLITEHHALETRIGPEAHIRSHSVIYAGNVIGSNFSTGHSVLIRESNILGDQVSVGTHTVIEHHVRLGNDVRIHSNAFIPEYSIIEDGAWIGPNVVFTNARYPRSRGVKKRLKGPHVLSGAKVGANSTVLPGVVIGREALVGAGAVVTKDVADGQVVVGNPARVIGDIRQIAAYEADELFIKS